MGDAVRVKYTVIVAVDPDVWMSNYGLAPGVTVVEDVQDSMQSVVAELVNDYISKTGNSGYAVAMRQ
jgi:hypothetical protein